MTPAFIAGAAALLLATLGLLLRPYLIRRKPGAAASQRRLNIAIYRDQLDELERDRTSGALAEADYATAYEEIQRRLLDDDVVDDAPAAVVASGRGTLAAIALVVPLLAGGLYVWLGNPVALNPPQAQHKVSAAEIEDMVTKLAARLEKDDNPQGWVMLARSYKILGRYEDAAKAYGRAGSFLDTEPVLLADYADILVAASGTFAGKPRELIARALKIEPDNAHALWLSGTGAFEAGQFDLAIAEWERLLALLPANSDEARSVQSSIGEARAQGGKSLGAKRAIEKPARSGEKVGASATVTGRVELAAALKDKAAPGDTVMVIARPADGSRMPVAVLKARVPDLPLAFSLDDSLAMSPDHAMSKFKEIIIEARISRTGMATPQAGDLLSAPQTVPVGKAGIKLLVDQVRP
ncbi:MAG: c-type cytochrome biogenesis protein CcmI [Gammaproteobacteria bacterium]|nr:c-type cytochrome biogenesis protein CcmI [Gammaproteobacteria bacterium]MBU1645134.1 c-type cytochrome biogenesis protein CcmI [Gammaproteobacteria bacterium]MBU1973371.1 c-type cytochrome biogenesis protein CcmI [Gammaproteobacteria bacterium]